MNLGILAFLGLLLAAGSKAKAAQQSAQPARPGPRPPRPPRGSVTLLEDEIQTVTPTRVTDAAAIEAAVTSRRISDADAIAAARAAVEDFAKSTPQVIAPPSAIVVPPVVQCPAGYDPEKARRTAKATANHVANRKYNYARKLLADWQRAAGLAPDGIYGGATAGALRFYGVRDTPTPLFKPTAVQPFSPPC